MLPALRTEEITKTTFCTNPRRSAPVRNRQHEYATAILVQTALAK